jgi:hypothetical protein
MGLFDKQKPVQDEAQQAAWLADRARIASFLYRARTFNGTGPEDPTLTVGLRSGERALLVATGTFLVEPRRVQAHWAGVSGGFSFHVPQQAAQFEGFQGGGDLTPVDTGDLTFTDQRIVFAGGRQSREWEFSSLLGFHHADNPPWTAIAVSGQDRVSGFRYDEGQAGEIRFAIVLGLARFHNALDSLVADLQEQLDAFDRAHSTASATGPVQTWQNQPGPGVPAGAPPFSGTPEPTGQPVLAGAGGGAMGATSASSAWPPANPFGAAPVGAAPMGAAASSPSGQAPVTWSDDPAQLAPRGPDSSAPGSGAEPVVTQSHQTDAPTGVPASELPPSGPLATEPPANPGSGQAAEPANGAQSSPPQASETSGPTPAEDTEVPTGEIPAVAVSPTATYPAVAQQPAAAGVPSYQSVQPVQQTQPQAVATAQATPSTPPGWYPDPWRVARVRWWDGYSWTSYTSH